MRKTTERVCRAFIEGRSCHDGNGSTDGQTLLLFGNRIAWRVPIADDEFVKNKDCVMITLAGHPTATTRRWLNGLCELVGLGQILCQYRKRQMMRDVPIGSYDRNMLTELDGGVVMLDRPE